MEGRAKSLLVFWFPLLLWMAVIFVLSSIPGRNIPSSWVFHQAGHFIEYSVLGVLWVRALAHIQIKWHALMLSFFSVVLGALFAVSDEWHQSFVPGRTADLVTVFFDVAYAAFGVFLYQVLVCVFLKGKIKA